MLVPYAYPPAQAPVLGGRRRVLFDHIRAPLARAPEPDAKRRNGSALLLRNVTVAGHRTSMRLQPAMGDAPAAIRRGARRGSSGAGRCPLSASARARFESAENNVWYAVVASGTSSSTRCVHPFVP